MARGLAVAAVVAAACADHGATAPDDTGPSFVRAAVTGAAAETYAGTGTFATGGGQFGGSVRTFFVNSAQGDAASERSFILWQQGTGRPPAVGTSAVAWPDYSRATWAGPAFIYTRRDGARFETYVGIGGAVTITASSATRVRGTFRITARQYCSSHGPGAVPASEGACTAAGIAADPVVEVDGEFSATQDPLIITARPGSP